MTKLYEALENCLNDIERGADVETVLFRYPDLADELRPILEASTKAREMSPPGPSPEIMRRNRAKLLQRAAEMREMKSAPARAGWFTPLQRAAVALTVLALIFASGTGLVRAASNTLPGDNLYRVKRGWEDVTVFFTFDGQKREFLEVEHENERLDELHELFASRRSAPVAFSGIVTRQNGSEWLVARIPILISPQTDLPDQPVPLGAAVRVAGQTQTDGSVLAEQIELLPPNAVLPEVEDEPLEEENQNGSNRQGGEERGAGSGGEAPRVTTTKTPKPESEPRMESFEGIVESIDSANEVWTINGQTADVSQAEIQGTPAVGATVKVEGYLDPDGVFVVTKAEIEDGGSNSGSGSGSNRNDNSRDDNSNDDSHNENDDDKSDGHGGNSGSGGGGDD